MDAPAPALLGPLHQVALPAGDLAKSVAFYRDSLGLRPIASFDPPGLAFFELAGTRLMLGRSEAPAPGSTLYLRVADIDAAYAALTARGVAFERPPAAVHRDEAGQFGPAGETEWMAFFRDPSGNLLALVSRR